ncbi:MAG: hypothetical protein GY815_11695 [Gammaproteobacteria bacterium]|nr:hypothetical protein [Gammaproteobacteria bacterium]
MLIDIAGTIVAFSVIMLLLSLLVTSLSQVTQHYLRLRGRNLRFGIRRLLESETDLDPTECLKSTNRILNGYESNPLRGQKESSHLAMAVLGSKVTWIESKPLEGALSKELGEDADSKAIAKKFEQFDKPLRKRFAQTMRLVSIGWAVVIAATFQVSTPELIKNLSLDREYRNEIVKSAPDLLKSTESQIHEISNSESSYTESIQKLSKSYPEIKEAINGLEASALYPGDLSEELADKIEDHEDLESIIVEFEGYLYQEAEKRLDQNIENLKQISSQLHLIDIRPFRDEMRFYYDQGKIQIRNIIGILVTAILLMLGAPFWFNSLTNALAFHDLLKPKDSQTKSKGKGGEK